MFNTIIDSFDNLDSKNKNKILKIVSNFINPIKLYLIVVMFLLLIMCISNYMIYRKFDLLKVLNTQPT